MTSKSASPWSQRRRCRHNDGCTPSSLNNIYYTGGWTNGAGLHQEIMAMSLDIAKRLRGAYREEDANVALTHNPEHIPMYLRVAASEQLKPMMTWYPPASSKKSKPIDQ